MAPESSARWAPASSEDPTERELLEIEDLRRRALGSCGILYCSEGVRNLIER